MSLNAIKLAKDLIRFQEAENGVVIKRFPSVEDVVVVNPFILELNTTGQYLKMAISFDEYPANLFPKIIFQQIPICPVHQLFPHPNININTGVMELRPKLTRNIIHVSHVSNFIRYILENPVHYEGSCAPLQVEEIIDSFPTPQLNHVPVTSALPQVEVPFMEHVKNLSSIFTVIKTGLEIGKIFLALIGL